MRKFILPILILFVLSLSSTVFADDQQWQQQQRQQQKQKQQQQYQKYQTHHNWSHPAYHHERWHPSERSFEGTFPFGWHDQHERYGGERVYDSGWAERFPGLHPLRWHGDGFWYHENQIFDAMLFYNDADELVGVGFMDGGMFVFIRDYGEMDESTDIFFSTWFHF